MDDYRWQEITLADARSVESDSTVIVEVNPPEDGGKNMETVLAEHPTAETIQLNLSRFWILSAAMIGRIINLNIHAKKTGKSLILDEVRSIPRLALEAMQLHKVLTIN